VTEGSTLVNVGYTEDPSTLTDKLQKLDSVVDDYIKAT